MIANQAAISPYAMPVINALLTGPEEFSRAVMINNRSIFAQTVFPDVLKAVDIVRGGIGSRGDDKGLLKSINDSYGLDGAFEVLKAARANSDDMLDATLCLAKIFQEMPSLYFAPGRMELARQIHRKNGAGLFVEKKLGCPVEPLSAGIDGRTRVWNFHNGVQGIWKYLEPLWPPEKITTRENVPVFGPWYEDDGQLDSEQKENILEGALTLMDVAKRTRSDQMPEQVFYFILSLAIYAVERFMPNGAQMAYDWTRWEVETEKDLHKVYQLAWLYSNLVYDPTDERTSHPPTKQQQDEVVFAALQRREMPQDGQRKLMKILGPWDIRVIVRRLELEVRLLKNKVLD